MEHAACFGTPQTLWFAHAWEHDLIATALAICAQCPVRVECLTDALGDDSRRGIWGRVTEAERNAMRGNRPR
jgi:WhiB family redox-sensing transcriptional regulator